MTQAPPPVDPNTHDAALPRGLRLGAFEIQRVIARSSSTVVYLATDHGLALDVAIQEFMPLRFARRDAGLQMRAAEPWHEDVLARGLRAFIAESRMLARCEHAGLVRVNQLFESLGSAYRVMPFYVGQRLSDLRPEMNRPPDEAALRRLLDTLLGAAEALHLAGHAHGNITPSNILLLADDRAVLLAPGAAGREVGTDLVDSLMATVEVGAGGGRFSDSSSGVASGAARDLGAVAAVARYCLTGVPEGTSPAREPLAIVLARALGPEARSRYSAALLGTLDAALSPHPEDRPLTAAQFRDWLDRGVPGGATVTFTPRQTLAPAVAVAGTGSGVRTDAVRSTDAAGGSGSVVAATGSGAPTSALASPTAVLSTSAPSSPVAPLSTPAATPTPAPPPAVSAPSARAAPRFPGNGSASSRVDPVVLPPGPAGEPRAPAPPSPARGPAGPAWSRSTQPVAQWPEASPDLIAPIVPERPPWVAPPLPPRLARPAATRARRYQALLVTALTASAAAVLAVATGWLHLSPEIQFEPLARQGASPSVALQQPRAGGSVGADITEAAEPGPASATRAEPGPGSSGATGMSGDPAPAASTGSIAPITASPPRLPGSTETVVSTANDPDRLLTERPPGAGRAPEAPRSSDVPSDPGLVSPAGTGGPGIDRGTSPTAAAGGREGDRTGVASRTGTGAGTGTGTGTAADAGVAPIGSDSSARPVRNGAPESLGPRGACLGRTEFALYRCMQQQCEVRRWSAHPQCIRLRRDDQVD